MALTNNPNKTKSIEKKWNREISVRWKTFISEFKKIDISDLIINIDDQQKFVMDMFIRDFEILVTRVLLGGGDGAWQNKYQTSTYERSAKRVVESVKPSLKSSSLGGFLTTAVNDLLSLPSSRNELDFLHGRANDKLQGWTTLLKQEVKEIVRNKFGTLSKFELAELIKARIDVAESRARMIATTEITQAAQHSSINLSSEVEGLIGEEVNVRWISVLDSKVRHLHANWHGKIFTKAEAESKMNISPWNCRCGLKPVVESLDSDKTVEKFKKEREVLLSREIKSKSKKLANNAK